MKKRSKKQRRASAQKAYERYAKHIATIAIPPEMRIGTLGETVKESESWFRIS